MRVLYSLYLSAFILIVGCSKSDIAETSDTSTKTSVNIDLSSINKSPNLIHDDAIEGIYKGTLGNTSTGFHEIVFVDIKNSSDRILATISSTDNERIVLEGNWNAFSSQYIFKNENGYFTLKVENGKLLRDIRGEYYGAELFGAVVKETSVRAVVPTRGDFFATVGPSVIGYFDIYWTRNGDTYEPITLAITDQRFSTAQLFNNSDPDIDVTYTRTCTHTLLSGGIDNEFTLDATATFDRNLGASLQRLSFQYYADYFEPAAPSCNPTPANLNVATNNWQSASGSGIIFLAASDFPPF